MLTEDQVRYGYWAEKQLTDKIPPSITEVMDYQGEEVLSISCTQLSATKYEKHQKRIISEWYDALPHLNEVKTLLFQTRVNQRLFDAASLMPNLEALYVKWGGIKSVASIVNHRRLQVLTLGSNPGIQDIELLGNMTGLYVLELENVPEAYHLDFLARLGNLEALGIDGSMWRTQSVASLEPLTHLQRLKFLSLANTRVKDGGLKPLLGIKTLVHVRTSFFFSATELTYLRVGLPLLAYGSPLEEDTIAKYARH